MFRTATIGLLLCISDSVVAVDYNCMVEKKFNSEHTYSAEHIRKYKFSIKIEDRDDGTFLSRCSYSISKDKVTCDRYKADKVVFDDYVNIKKYYYFIGQFDIQLFPSLSFVENNGRGDIAYGNCKVFSP